MCHATRFKFKFNCEFTTLLKTQHEPLLHLFTSHLFSTALYLTPAVFGEPPNGHNVAAFCGLIPDNYTIKLSGTSCWGRP